MPIRRPMVACGVPIAEANETISRSFCAGTCLGLPGGCFSAVGLRLSVAISFGLNRLIWQMICHKFDECFAGCFKRRRMPGEILPARHGDVDISRAQLDRMAGATGHLACD